VLEAGVWSNLQPFYREPICSTGRCSWRDYQSVGWCSKCEYRTSSATIGNCKFSDIVERKSNVSDYCVLNLGSGASFSLLRDLDVRFWDGRDGNNTRFDGNFTSEVIWPLSYGNSGTTLSNLDAPELSSGPTTFLGVLNPLITIGQAKVQHQSGEYEYYPDANLLQIVEASQCILNPCEKTLSLTRINGTTVWADGNANYGHLIAKNVSLLGSFGSHGPGPLGTTVLCWQAEEGELDLTNFDENRSALYDSDEIATIYTVDDSGAESYSVDKNKRAFCPVEDYAYYIQKFLRGQYDEEFAVNWSPTDTVP
jgi:hypothetical protein